MKDQSHMFQWWFSYLAEFHFTVKFRPGKLNTNADSLTCLPLEKLDGSDPVGFVMKLSHELEDECLFEFNVNQL